MKVVAIVQARMGSTRLPGKVLMDVGGAPMLARDVARLSRAPGVHQVVVATSTEGRDDAVAELCMRSGWACFRGSEEDVLDRYHGAAKAHAADVVVRITADCPLIDPQVTGQVVQAFFDSRADYASNVYPVRSYPRGLDTEVLSFSVLSQLWTNDRDPRSREHVTPGVRRAELGYRIHNVVGEADHSAQRWTVDTPEDLELVRRIYAHFGGDGFSWREVLDLLAKHPDWVALNRHVAQKTR